MNLNLTIFDAYRVLPKVCIGNNSKKSQQAFDDLCSWLNELVRSPISKIPNQTEDISEENLLLNELRRIYLNRFDETTRLEFTKERFAASLGKVLLLNKAYIPSNPFDEANLHALGKIQEEYQKLDSNHSPILKLIKFKEEKLTEKPFEISFLAKNKIKLFNQALEIIRIELNAYINDKRTEDSMKCALILGVEALASIGTEEDISLLIKVANKLHKVSPDSKQYHNRAEEIEDKFKYIHLPIKAMDAVTKLIKKYSNKDDISQANTSSPIINTAIDSMNKLQCKLFLVISRKLNDTILEDPLLLPIGNIVRAYKFNDFINNLIKFVKYAPTKPDFTSQIEMYKKQSQVIKALGFILNVKYDPKNDFNSERKSFWDYANKWIQGKEKRHNKLIENAILKALGKLSNPQSLRLLKHYFEKFCKPYLGEYSNPSLIQALGQFGKLAFEELNQLALQAKLSLNDAKEIVSILTKIDSPESIALLENLYEKFDKNISQSTTKAETNIDFNKEFSYKEILRSFKSAKESVDFYNISQNLAKRSSPESVRILEKQLTKTKTDWQKLSIASSIAKTYGDSLRVSV